MKIFTTLLLTLITAMSVSPGVLDMTQVDTEAVRVSLNHGNSSVFGRYDFGTQVTTEKKWLIRATYDFAVSGGAISTITLKGSEGSGTPTIPKGAIVTKALFDVVTAPTSGGSATLAFSTGQSAADLKAATAYSSFSGIVAGIPVETAATAIKMTADRNPTVAIATATVTAGKIYVLIEYIMSKTN